jgi:hypothetical protein
VADITVTASAVRGTNQDSGIAGATLAAGKVVYRDSGSLLQLSDNNVVAAAKVDGITVCGGDAGQAVNLIKSGDLTLQGGLTAGTFYYLSGNAGGICPVADLASGSKVILIGYAISATVLRLHFVDTGITLP